MGTAKAALCWIPVGGEAETRCTPGAAPTTIVPDADAAVPRPSFVTAGPHPAGAHSHRSIVLVD